MGDKSTATATPERVSSQGSKVKQDGGVPSSLGAAYPSFGLQQTLGNQALLRLLDSGTIRTKLRVSQPGDADEQEADRAAEQVVATMRAPKIQRKCGCGGTCASCSEEENQTIHRNAKFPFLLSSPPGIQRAPDDKAGTAPEEPHHHAHKKAHDGPGVEALVIEDEAKEIKPHQMRKSQFIALLRTDACATADAVLASVGKTTKSCPYIEKWLGSYEKQSASHIATAVRKYAPESAKARSAHEVIRLVVVRIQRAAMTWAKTGKVEGLPDELAKQISGKTGFLEKLHNFASTGVAGAIFGFIGGKGSAHSGGGHATDESPHEGKGSHKQDSGSATISRKAQEGAPANSHDAASVRAQLGSGHSLDSRVQSQMSSAFGQDFSRVRVHTDSQAAKLSSDLSARAFTIGSDVAFADGEYKPGTLVGDALIAHELAHVVQQGWSTRQTEIHPKSAESDSALEQDADISAVQAILSLRSDREQLKQIGSAALPTLKSGLRLSRCKTEKDPFKDSGVGDTGVKAAGVEGSTAQDAGPTDAPRQDAGAAQTDAGTPSADAGVGCPPGYTLVGNDFLLTSFFLTSEDQFPEHPVVANPCGLRGTWRRGFLHDVRMEGSGQGLSGTIIRFDGHRDGQDCFTTDTCARGASNRCLTANTSVAVDRSVIPLGTQLWIEGIGNRQADDTGGRIRGHHIDLYLGAVSRGQARRGTFNNRTVCRR